MKKNILILMLFVSPMFLNASAVEGQKYFIKKMKACKESGFFNGIALSVTHSKVEWTDLFKNNKFKSELSHLCPKVKDNIEQATEEELENLYNFLEKYAADGEVIDCG